MTEGEDQPALPEYLRAPGLIEKLAAAEHDRWAHWQRYLHAQCQPASDGSLTIPAERVQQWTRQMTTPYADLSDAEKESDREQVYRYLPIIAAALGGDG